MKQIKKVLIQAFGDETQITVVNSNINDPKPNEVQIKVEYSPVSGADINMRKGTYPFQHAAPLTPGYSLIGRIEKIGSKSNQFKGSTGG